jgi:hypothetical protein
LCPLSARTSNPWMAFADANMYSMPTGRNPHENGCMDNSFGSHIQPAAVVRLKGLVVGFPVAHHRWRAAQRLHDVVHRQIDSPPEHHRLTYPPTPRRRLVHRRCRRTKSAGVADTPAVGGRMLRSSPAGECCSTTSLSWYAYAHGQSAGRRPLHAGRVRRAGATAQANGTGGGAGSSGGRERRDRPDSLGTPGTSWSTNGPKARHTAGGGNGARGGGVVNAGSGISQQNLPPRHRDPPPMPHGANLARPVHVRFQCVRSPRIAIGEVQAHDVTAPTANFRGNSRRPVGPRGSRRKSLRSPPVVPGCQAKRPTCRIAQT